MLQIGKELVKNYKRMDLPLQYIGTVIYILHNLNEKKYENLDLLDDENKERSIISLYKTLEYNDLIESLKDSNSIYDITDKGKYLLEIYYNQDENNTITKLQEKIEESDKPSGYDIAQWINEWILLFPEKNEDRRALRSDAIVCLPRMDWFIKTYKYDKDTIFKATRAYLDSLINSKDGLKYAKSSHYFIIKGRTKIERESELAKWCEIVTKDDFHSSSDYTSNLV